jgi:PAS domain S-box-containing protein
LHHHDGSRGIITEFNPAAERTFGYSRAEAVGRSLGDLIVPPSLRQQHGLGLARSSKPEQARSSTSAPKSPRCAPTAPSFRSN